MSGSDDLVGGSKLGKWLVIAVIVIALPTLAIMDVSLKKGQKLVDENAEKSWAKPLQRFIAGAYSIKFRHAEAAQAYEYASRFYFAEHDEPTAAWMLFYQANEIEAKDSTGKWAALPLYEKIAEEYPKTDAGAKASMSVTRIKTMSRP
jgi:hypothetical protein